MKSIIALLALATAASAATVKCPSTVTCTAPQFLDTTVDCDDAAAAGAVGACDAATCCKDPQQCSAAVNCGTLTPIAGATCTTDCNEATCCEPAAPAAVLCSDSAASSVTCPTGKQPIAAKECQAGSTGTDGCTETNCCEVVPVPATNGTCSSMGVACPNGFKTGYSGQELTCTISTGTGYTKPSNPCTTAYCCKPAPPPPAPCTGYGCPVPPPPAPCTGYGCPKPTPAPCTGYGCPKPTPAPCTGYGCPKPTPVPCTGYGCPKPTPAPCTGYGCPKPPAPAPAYKVCSAAVACAKYKVDEDGDEFQCKGDGCTVAACCKLPAPVDCDEKVKCKKYNIDGDGDQYQCVKKSKAYPCTKRYCCAVPKPYTPSQQKPASCADVTCTYKYKLNDEGKNQTCYKSILNCDKPCSTAFCCVPPPPPAPEPTGIQRCNIKVKCAVYNKDSKVGGIRRCKNRTSTSMPCTEAYCCAPTTGYSKY